MVGWVAYSKPMCEWTRRVAQRMASVTGLREPAAKGAMVKGMRAADISLWLIGLSVRDVLMFGRVVVKVPLERPVVATVGVVWGGDVCSIVDCGVVNMSVLLFAIGLD